jgi:LysM domain
MVSRPAKISGGAPVSADAICCASAETRAGAGTGETRGTGTGLAARAASSNRFSAIRLAIHRGPAYPRLRTGRVQQRPAAPTPSELPVNPTPARYRLRGHVRTAASLAAAASLLAAAPLVAQDTPAQERVHVVQPGETLWDIARAYLNDPFLWPEIFRLNADVVEDPARIYPSERLVLPGGEPAMADGGFAQEQAATPEGQRVRLGLRAERPAVLQGDFYRASFVAPQGEVPLVGRLMEQEYQSVVDNRMPMQTNLYDRVFVRVDPAAVEVGDRLHFVREGRMIDRRRRVYQPTGAGTVAALDGETATVVVVGMYDRVEVGDVVIPVEAFPIRTTERPRTVDADLQGRILAFLETGPMQRPESILFLDIGRDAGVAVGDEFEAYEPPAARRWGTRPEMPVARMQVVRVTEGTASVRVTELEQPRIAVGQSVRRVARMP